MLQTGTMPGPALPLHGTLPRRAGLGFRPEHAGSVLGGTHDCAWFEVHAENYMGAGGPALAMLSELRALYPLSLHGVALSLGGPPGRLDREHLARLRRLVDYFAPESFSEHLAWSTHEGVYFDDLLPLPYTQTTLLRVCGHIDEAQEALGMRLLLENPTGYLAFPEAEMAEVDFLREVARRTGCGLLLDVANVHASAVNLGFDAGAYLDAYPLHLVGEIHLAGQAVEVDDEGNRLVIDTHDRAVSEDVWASYAALIDRAGPIPTLIERDADIPAWSILANEAAAVDQMLTTGAAARHASAI